MNAQGKQRGISLAGKPANKQRGITMIEILVAILILAIGFLGMASVQLMGAKNIAGSSFRTLATIYAYDMVERMRLNPVGIQNDFYNSVDGSKVTNPNCGNACTPQQVAQRDAFEWNQMIQAGLTDGGLPAGQGDVAYNATDQLFEVTVQWRETIRIDDDYPAATGALQQFELAVKLEP